MRRVTALYTVILVAQLVLVSVLATQRGLILADPTAHRLDWWRTWGGDQTDYAYSAVVVDGSLYVTGATYSDIDAPVRLLLLRYDTNGTLLWAVTHGEDGYTMGRGVVTDGSSIYVAGIRITDAGASSILLKFGFDGQLIWSREWSPGPDAKASGVAIDPRGNVFVTGYVEASATGNLAFLLRYDGAGDLAFSKVFPSDGTDTAWGIALGDAVYVCGETTPNAADVAETGLASANALVMKVSFDGDVVWRREARLGQDNVANSVVAGDEITVVGYTTFVNGTAKELTLRYTRDGELKTQGLAGQASIEDVSWGIGTAGQYTYIVGSTRPLFTDMSDATIQKLDSSGNLQWNDYYTDYSTDRAIGVAVSGDDVYLIGETYWRAYDMQVLVIKYVSANEALIPAVSQVLMLSPLAIGVLLILLALCVARR